MAIRSWQQQASEVVTRFGKLVCSTSGPQTIGGILTDFYFGDEPIKQPFRVVGPATKAEFIAQAQFLRDQRPEDITTLGYFYSLETD